ncbi:MAG: choice-of-anchor tandem repeat GloVer-containing protein [Terriglobales bacterium]
MRKAFLCAAMVALSCGLAFGQAQYKVLYNFQGAQFGDGDLPGGLVSDRAGNLYGVTEVGGIAGGCEGGGCGVVYELSPNSNGTWSEMVLYAFCAKGVPCVDGAYPVPGLVLDSGGNLYGVTEYGGIDGCYVVSGLGCGIVFELSPPSPPGVTWTYKLLYTFCSVVVGGTCEDGALPFAGLTLGESRNLYGTTSEGGSGSDGGAVFELSLGAGGWIETVLYGFCSTGGEYCSDGIEPLSGVTFDKDGNLYGTTAAGGSTNLYGAGTLFELSPQSGGWKESVLLAFSPSKSQPQYPYGLNIDPLGNFYLTFRTGKNGYGGVGRYSKGALRSFIFNGTDGDAPDSELLIDTRRRILYGATSGALSAPGNIFEINSSGKETVLFTFCQPDCTYGYEPTGGVIEDGSGNLYGTAEVGGTGDAGVVYELTP